MRVSGPEVQSWGNLIRTSPIRWVLQSLAKECSERQNLHDCSDETCANFETEVHQIMEAEREANEVSHAEQNYFLTQRQEQ